MDLWASVDIQARERMQTRSQFINEILRTILGSTKSYIAYQLQSKSREFNYAKYLAENYNSDKEINTEIDKLKAGR